MSRRVSLNARQNFDAQSSTDVEVVLMMFEHPFLDAPVRLTTDPTVRLSTDPLEYGTRSTWRGSDPATEPFKFIIVSAELPGDQEETPAAARIIIENLHHGIGEVLRSFTDWATVHLAVVMASTPDLIELELADLKLVASEGDLSEFVLSAGRPNVESESVPMDRMTPDRFPGLYQ